MTNDKNRDKMEEIVAIALRAQWYDMHSNLPLSWRNEMTHDKIYQEIPDRAKAIVTDLLKI